MFFLAHGCVAFCFKVVRKDEEEFSDVKPDRGGFFENSVKAKSLKPCKSLLRRPEQSSGRYRASAAT